MLLQPEYLNQLSISPHQACFQYLLLAPVPLPAPAVHVPALRLQKDVYLYRRKGDFTPRAHPGLISLLASSSAPFRNVIRIIYRWEYVSGKGKRAELLPRKKEQGSEFLRMWFRCRWKGGFGRDRSNDKWDMKGEHGGKPGGEMLQVSV